MAEENAHVTTGEPATDKKTRVASEDRDLAASAVTSVVKAGEAVGADSTNAGGTMSYSDSVLYARRTVGELQGMQNDTITGRTMQEASRETQNEDVVYLRTNPSPSSSSRCRDISRPRATRHREGDHQ